MPSINDLFPSKWLTAADLKGQSMAVTIEKIELETMKGRDGKPDETKPVVFFEELDKGMVCNKTNAGTIGKFYGDNTDDWIGERITIFPTKVNYGKELVDAIRVDTQLPRKPKKNGTPASAKQAEPEPEPSAPLVRTGKDALNDDIPF